jgi:hypothetical protein
MNFCIDVTVVNPLAEAYFNNSVNDPLHDVMAAEERKMVQYVDACRLANLGFLPFGMSTLGAFTAISTKIMDRLAAGRLTGPQGSKEKNLHQYSDRNDSRDWLFL